MGSGMTSSRKHLVAGELVKYVPLQGRQLNAVVVCVQANGMVWLHIPAQPGGRFVGQTIQVESFLVSRGPHGS